MKRVFSLALAACCFAGIAHAQFIIEKKDASQVEVEGNAVFSETGVEGVPYADIASISRSTHFIVTFEDCDLGDAHNNIVSGQESFYREDGIRFVNNSLASLFSGVVVSDASEVSDWEAEYVGQCAPYRVITTDASKPAGADGSAKYAVFYYDKTIATSSDYMPEFKFSGGEVHKILSLDVNNIADIWQKCKIGFYSKPAFSEGDYYDVVFTGYDADGNETGTVTVPMADFRDGKTLILNEWTNIDLSELGEINKLSVTYDSTDTFNELFYNTGVYGVCIDNIKFE